jgi:hypothetical protein
MADVVVASMVRVAVTAAGAGPRAGRIAGA